MLLPLFVIALLTAVNALYVAAEFAAVSVQKSQLAPLARDGNRSAAGLLVVLDDGAQLDRYIAACQIGITLSSLVAGAYGQATIAVTLGPWLEGALSIGPSAARSSAFVIVLLLLTTLQVVLGELVPKSLALQFPERSALATYLPLRWSMSLYRGFIWLLNGSGFLLLSPFGVKPGGHQHVHSPQEIQFLLAESHRGGELSPEAHRRLERGLRLSTRQVRQLMTPRSELYAIEVTASPEEVLEKVFSSPYSRIPVYEGTLDRIIGTVNTKDVASSFALRGKIPPLTKLLRPILFVPETLGAHRFVRQLQERQSSKAIVVDEFGGVEGIVSIEDVMTQLFGNIGDELQKSDHAPERRADGTVRLPGDLTLDAAEPWLGMLWDGSSSTVGGHVVAQFGRMPSVGERVEIEGLSVTVEEMGRTAIRWIVVEPKQEFELPEAVDARREEQN